MLIHFDSLRFTQIHFDFTEFEFCIKIDSTVSECYVNMLRIVGVIGVR